MAKESWKTREATAKSQKKASAKNTSQNTSQKSGSSRADYNRNFFNSEMEKYQKYDRETFRAASLLEFQQKQIERRGQDLYDDFNRQASAFDRAVARDLSDESGFNAAQYFEERQKQANALKQRADTLKLFMEDHMDLYTPEFYDPLMESMSTFNTQVDDVLAQYKPSLESKAGMRAYEDELLAAMERDKKLNADGNLGVNDNWSAEQRYRLGLMQMTDPNEAKKYAAAVNAGQDPYLLYQQQEQQKANWRAMDLVAEKREIDRLKAELDNYYWNSDYDATSVNERNAFDQEIKRREKEISDREQQYNLAKREQENAQFQSATERSDFASRSGYVGTGFEMPTYVEDADPDELVYEYINDPGVRKQINQQTTDLAAKGYDLLNEEEIGIYNYYYATEGPLKAQQYLDNIQDTLNQRIGERGAAAKSGDLWKQLMAGTIAGYSNAVTSPQYFFDKDSEYINTNPSQYMSAAIREDMADTGPVLPGVLGGASLGQMAFDLANTAANMAPSILLSTAANAIIPGSGALVGAATMGSSAAGGAYQQALNAGYSKEQARNYAALAGAAEVGLEYLLGGISKLGGEIPQNVLREIVGSVDNAIAKAAITLGGSMASEGFEEGLQEIITPWLENLVLYADKDVNWNDVAYSTLLGALSGGVMEGPGVVSNTVMTSRRNKLLMDLARSKVDAENASAAEAQPAPQEPETKKPAEKPAVSKEGRSIQISTESPIDTMDFAEIKNGKATIQLKDGGTVDYSDVSFATEAEANQYYAVSTLPGIETDAANDLLHTIQEAGAGRDDQGIIAVREAYRLGYAGAQASELANSDASALTPDLQQKIFEIGQSQRRADAMAKPTVREAATKPTEGYKKVVIEGKISKPNKKTQKKWDTEIAFMDYIADNFSGNAVHVYESYKGMDGKYYYRDSNGKVNRAPNGMYVNGEIWVDLRSGDNQEGLVLNTFAHEMYHHIERFDKAKAQELAEFVVKELGIESVDKAVDAQIQKARKAGFSEAYFMNVKGMTAEQARNEVYMRAMSDFVADSLETMFTRGDPAKAIADLKKENRTLFDQIKAFINKWVSKLKDFYKDKTVSEEGAVVAQLKNFEQLQKLFMEGVQSAGENYREALKEPQKGTRKENVAQFSNRYADQITEQDREYLDSVNRGDMVAVQRMVDNEAKRWGAFLNNSEANEVFPQRGEVRTFYHGTNTGDFTVFDKGLLGNSSGDLGWFGKGFYFAFSADEANAYGGRVIRAYLKMKNPYDYSQLYKFKGSDRGSSQYARFAWLYNIVKQFPDIVTDQKLYAYPNDSEEEKTVSWKQLVRWMDRIEKDAKFSVAKVELSNGDTAWELRANPKQESFTNKDGETFTWTEYGMRQLFATEMDAKEPINQIGAYLVNVMGVESIPRRSIEKIDFSGAVQRAGYDGIIQSPSGDEAVVFEPSQIKLADPVTYDYDGNIIPVSHRFNRENEDIRYSLRNEKPATDRDILMNLDANAQKVSVKGHLQRYQDRLTKLAELEPVHEDLKAQIEGLSQAEKPNYKEINRLKSEERRIRVDVNQMNGMVRSFERSDMGKRLVAEERLKIQKAEFKSFREEQKALARANTAEQRLIREELTGVTSIMTVMEDEFIKLAKDYEEQKIDLKTMEEEFMRLANEYDKQTKDVNIWEREFKRLLKEYDTIKGQRERAKAKVETLQKQDQRKKVESQVKSLMKMLKNPTKDAHIPMVLQEPLRKFLDSIDFTSRRQASGGSPTIKDIAYAKALRAIRDAVASQRTAMDVTNGTFALDVPAEFLDRIENHIKVIEGSTEGLNLTTNRVYEMRSEELKDLNHILTVINKAIRQIDKFHLQGERARISGYAKETVQEMESRKPVKGENGNKYLWGNSTPWYAFRRYGKAGQKIFKGLMQGQAKLAKNIDSIVKFAEETYTNKEVREWERKRHTIKLDSGKAVTMSTAQIMSFWCLSNRDQAIPHMQGGGMRPTTLKKSVDGTNVQNEMVQKEHFTLTRADVNRINNLLTGRQREVAGKLQQFMQTVGGRFVNEVSMARWDYMAATETDYFPIQTDDTGRDVKNPEQERTSLFALLNKSFTKAPVKNSRNALVVDSIFNVFANHMSETAEYNAFALPLVDAMKWFNYNERIDVGDGHIKDVSVHNAIKNTLGKNAKQYFIDLMTDINSSQKAGRYEDFFGKILGRSKVSSVAWNTRVAIQQLSALPRASMVLKPRYLLASVSKFRLQYAVKEMQKYSGIALWKSMGYYDLNVARSVERQIKHDTSFLDQFNETGMWLPGKMDERTWAKIWIATREQIKNERNLSGEELLRATADLFEEVVYQTQVADSVLTRSSFMRSKSQLIKEATSFMAEPTLATNILMYAFEDYETGHTTLEKAKRGLMIGFTGYALSAVANALLGSLSDAWRDDDEYETYWEKYGQALFGSKEKFFMDGNLFSELNPLEKFIFVKDLLSVAKGFEPNSSYSKLISGMLDLVNAYQSAAEGKTSKTAYGVVYQTLQYLSTVGGVGISNITRELVDVWNNTFGKWNPDQKLARYKPDNGAELLNAIQKGTDEDIQRVFGRFKNQKEAESALQSVIGEQYRDGKLTAEEAEKLLTENFDRDDEHEVYWILDKWDYAKKNGSSEGYLKYGKFLEDVETGDFEAEMGRLLQNGSDASDIRSEITRKYRKQYLEDETAREGIRQKLRPVFEATGMYDDEIQAKFHDWDFEAEYGVTYSEMKAEYRDGNITEAEMREAMDFYGLLNYEITEAIRSLNEDIAFEKKFGMTLSEMKDAYDRGDLAQNQMKNALVFIGMTQNEAKNWIKQRSISNQMGINYTELDDAYKYGDISRSDLRNSILKNGETVKNTDEAMMGYDWLKKNIKKYPDLAIDDAKKFAVRIHPDYAPDETLEDYGVSIDAYIDYQRLRPECKGVDANGDGKTDDGTLRDSIFQMIDSLPISSEAKDGLALMSYSAKSIRRNAPWH